MIEALMLARAQADMADTGPYPRLLLEMKLKGGNGLVPGAIVLRDFGPDHHDDNRFVTHMRVDFPDQPRPGYDHGGYFADRNEALQDYIERCVRKLHQKA